MPIKGQSPKEAVHTEMGKFKRDNLHSGSKKGPLVKSRKQAIAIALSESRKARKKYAEGGDVQSDADQAAMMPETYANPVAKHLVESAVSVPYNFVKSHVDASKYMPGSDEAHEAYGDVGKATGDMGLSMLGEGKPASNTAGVFVGPYGAHMLRQGEREAGIAAKPHPVYGQEVEDAAQKLRPEFRDAYKGWQVDARDAQGRGMLEMRQGSDNPYDADVFRHSGWLRGTEGMPKKEIPDLGTKLMPNGHPDQYLVDHPAGNLHEVYGIPPIKADPETLRKYNARAAYNPDTGQVTIRNPKEVSQSLHEVQHAIQRQEGFAGGSHPNLAANHPSFSQEYFEDRSPSWRERRPTNYLLDDDQIAKRERIAAAKEHYMNSAGEAEARNVQDRRAKGFRYMVHPESTVDRPAGTQWVNDEFKPRDITVHDTRDLRGIAKSMVEGRNYRTINMEKGMREREGYAGGGSVFGGFNPERAAAYGLSRQSNAPKQQGMIHSNIPGRTDKINMNVPPGTHIIPADIPSALGQGNSMAGNSILNKMFAHGPHSMNIGKSQGPRTHARSASLSKMRFAEGGETGEEATPIVAAGGEYVVHPDTVRQLGHGDMELGHDILDQFILHVRKNAIKTLRGLKPPKNSKQAKNA